MPCSGADAGMYMDKYSCDESQCQAPDCRCASFDPPIDNPIQLVSFTIDDAINAPYWDAVQEIVDYGHKNPNGCNITMTWFMSFDADPPCNMIPYIPSRYNEIAAHTIHHASYAAIDEIADSMYRASQCGGIKESDVVGYRPPYMMNAAWSYQALQALNFTYFSSNIDSYGDSGNTNGKRYWPYTLDFGVHGTCLDHCDPDMKAPGLWSVPMPPVTKDDGTVVSVMDPPFVGKDLEDIYMQSFMRHYNGNRSPFGIYIHSRWITDDPTRIDSINNIIEKMLSYDDVWFVSVRDVVKYMKDPKPAGTKDIPYFICPGPTPPEMVRPPAPRPAPGTPPTVPGDPNNPAPPTTNPDGPPATPPNNFNQSPANFVAPSVLAILVILLALSF